MAEMVNLEELERFYMLPLTAEEQQDILYRNALRLLGEPLESN